MNRMMNRVVTQALADVDVVVHVVEAGKWSEGDAKLLPLLPAPERTILVVSKIDALKNRDDLFAFVSKIMALHPFGAVVPVSATRTSSWISCCGKSPHACPKANRCSKRTR